MDIDNALEIVRHLANGRNPISHEPMQKSILSYPEISSALLVVISAATREAKRDQQSENDLKQSSLDAWSVEEMSQLREELRTGVSAGVIARLHRRKLTDVLHGIVKTGAARDTQEALRKFANVRCEPPNLVSRPPLESRKKKRPNSGTPWTGEEDAKLRSEFLARANIFEIARVHLRSATAISSRLVHLRLVDNGLSAFQVLAKHSQRA
jgi:hypothetical protein